MITQEQREQRKQFVGSSEIGALIGVDPYRNAADIFLEKTGQLAERTSGEVQNRGIVLEGYILSLFEAQLGITLARDLRVQGDDVCAANLDGALVDDSNLILAPVEAKSSNFGKDWNQETGQIPLLVLVQVSFQIMCAGPQCDHGFIPALVPEYQRFKFLTPVPIVKRNDELIEELRVAAHEFMDYVRKGKQPPNAIPHLNSLKRLRREPDTIVALGEAAAEMWEAFELAKERKRAAERDEEELKRLILAELGQAEAGRLMDGRVISFLEQNGARHCDIDRLQVLNPVLYDELVKQTRFRVLRIKKPKSVKAPKAQGAPR